MSVRGSSVTDYLILNKFSIKLLHDFKILDFSNFSDHAPVYFAFLINDRVHKSTKNNNNNKFQHKIVFDKEKIIEYKNKLKEHLNNIESSISPDTSVNMHSEILTTFIYEHALEVFGKSIPIKTENSTNSTQGPTWFNADCHQAKHDFKTARNIFKRNKTDENRIAFAKARTKYNKAR